MLDGYKCIGGLFLWAVNALLRRTLWCRRRCVDNVFVNDFSCRCFGSRAAVSDSLSVALRHRWLAGISQACITLLQKQEPSAPIWSPLNNLYHLIPAPSEGDIRWPYLFIPLDRVLDFGDMWQYYTSEQFDLLIRLLSGNVFYFIYFNELFIYLC